MLNESKRPTRQAVIEQMEGSAHVQQGLIFSMKGEERWAPIPPSKKHMDEACGMEDHHSEELFMTE